MASSDLQKKFISVGFFVPFRLQLLLIIAALFTGYLWLRKNISVPGSSYDAILHLLISVSLYFILILLVLGFLSSIIPWLLFYFNRKNGRVVLSVKSVNQSSTSSGQQFAIRISLKPVFPPPFGFIRFRILYGKNTSPKFTLVENQKDPAFFSNRIEGNYTWPARDIREYNVDGCIIYFEDIFQFFSFALKVKSHDTFVAQPSDQDIASYMVTPKKTQDTDQRIEEIRKVEGEYLNYKNFETSDDVRRIVWKIYAKNKELVIRIPETNDPYASHVYFYASFYRQPMSLLYENLDNIFLNYFKLATYNSFRQLTKKDVLAKYIPDQETRLPISGDFPDTVKYAITTSAWQNSNELIHYFKKSDASVLCISSYSNSSQLNELLSNSGKDLLVVFVRLSNVFKKVTVTDWLKWIFVKPSKDSLEKLRLYWNTSPLKREIVNNERTIDNILQKSDCQKIVL